MSDRMELTAEVRTDVGKGASRRLRRNADLVPGVVYGAGKEAVSITIPHKDLHKASESESFFSQILTLKTGSDSEPVILKDLQRHPARDRLMHADFFSNSNGSEDLGRNSAALPQRGQLRRREAGRWCGLPDYDQCRDQLPSSRPAGIHRN